tara:strand:+ start:489 stop:734 length:246 start_codon:yes stop_codon:yes gene_type:complete
MGCGDLKRDDDGDKEKELYEYAQSEDSPGRKFKPYLDEFNEGVFGDTGFHDYVVPNLEPSRFYSLYKSSYSERKAFTGYRA